MTATQQAPAQGVDRCHAAEMTAQAEELEQRILRLLDSGRITQAEAEDKLTYLFRTTASKPVRHRPCGCGEVLLWQSSDASGEQVLRCYACTPPTDLDRGASYYMAQL